MVVMMMMMVGAAAAEERPIVSVRTKLRFAVLALAPFATAASESEAEKWSGARGLMVHRRRFGDEDVVGGGAMGGWSGVRVFGPEDGAFDWRVFVGSFQCLGFAGWRWRWRSMVGVFGVGGARVIGFRRAIFEWRRWR